MPPYPGRVLYGTTLPANPYDGQEAILVDSVTNPSFTWRFRYNAASTSAYKWEHVGGGGACSGPMGSLDFTATAWTMFASGPIVAAPRAGEYVIEWGCVLNNSNPFAGVYIIQSVLSSGGPILSAVAEVRPTAMYGGSSVSSVQPVTLAANEQPRIWVSNQVGGNQSTVSRGYLRLIPTRVS
jgi:hypothetical protein